MALHATVPIEIEGCDAVADIVLEKGDTAAFAFGSVRDEELGSAEFLDTEAIDRCVDASSRFWRDWIKRST